MAFSPGLIERRKDSALLELLNLERHVPRHAHDDLRANYHRIVYAESMALARQAHWGFLTIWEKWSPKLTASLREASDELLAFYRFPPS